MTTGLNAVLEKKMKSPRQPNQLPFQKRLYTKPVTVESTEAGKSTTILLWDDNKIFRALILSSQAPQCRSRGHTP